MKYIKEKTYKGYVSVQDLDSYRDANGLLHREALSHVPIKCEFETIPLNNEQYEQIMNWKEKLQLPLLYWNITDM